MTERIPYDELSFFHENAEEFGLPWSGPPAVQRRDVELGEGRHISALVWGTEPGDLVLLHGGAQNAHTWDTVALALDRPLVAVDLPGHGHSDGARTSRLDVRANAADVAGVVKALAPQARGVVGMSLGGITALALAEQVPELVRAVVLVDITPGVTGEHATAIRAFIDGPPSFASFDDILARTIQYNPTRSVASLRRGILHNAVQQPDGSWVWRHARFADQDPMAATGFATLWDTVSSLQVPLMLVRGMLPSSVVDDDQEAELRRRCPQARVEHVERAGHSIQGDAPLELAALIDDFLPR